MKDIPKIIMNLVQAQDHFDSNAYANCFTETAVVFDEGKEYRGKEEIKQWIDKANTAYQITMTPIAYFAINQTLKAKVAGNFTGSPLVLTYQYEFENDQIQSLKIV